MYPRDTATITLTGPSNVWFGAGFNASAMKEGPWAVVVDGGSDGRVSEHKLADQGYLVIFPGYIKYGCQIFKSDWLPYPVTDC